MLEITERPILRKLQISKRVVDGFDILVITNKGNKFSLITEDKGHHLTIALTPDLPVLFEWAVTHINDNYGEEYMMDIAIFLGAKIMGEAKAISVEDGYVDFENMHGISLKTTHLPDTFEDQSLTDQLSMINSLFA